MANTRAVRQPQLLEAAGKLFLQHPLERVTLDMLESEAGIERTWVHRWGTRAELYRLACGQWLTACDDALITKVRTDRGVLRYLNDQASALAAVYQLPSYRNLMHIIIRDADTTAWLVEAYFLRIERLCCQIERRIGDAASRFGVTLAAPRDAVMQYIREMELGFALRVIGPMAIPQVRNSSRLIARVSADLHDTLVVLDAHAPHPQASRPCVFSATGLDSSQERTAN